MKIHHLQQAIEDHGIDQTLSTIIDIVELGYLDRLCSPFTRSIVLLSLRITRASLAPIVNPSRPIRDEIDV